MKRIYVTIAGALCASRPTCITDPASYQQWLRTCRTVARYLKSVDSKMVEGKFLWVCGLTVGEGVQGVRG